MLDRSDPAAGAPAWSTADRDRARQWLPDQDSVRWCAAPCSRLTMGAINQVDWEPLLSRLRDAVQAGRQASKLMFDEATAGAGGISTPRSANPRMGFGSAIRALAGAHFVRLTLLSGLLDRAEQIRLGAPGRRSARNWTLVRCALAFGQSRFGHMAPGPANADHPSVVIKSKAGDRREPRNDRLRPNDLRRVDCRLDARRSGPSSGWLAAHSSVPSGPPSLSRLPEGPPDIWPPERHASWGKGSRSVL